jgi:hypothetical protein
MCTWKVLEGFMGLEMQLSWENRIRHRYVIPFTLNTLFFFMKPNASLNVMLRRYFVKCFPKKELITTSAVSPLCLIFYFYYSPLYKVM